MSDNDEFDLSEAFKGLTAPRSTANYADRAPPAKVVDGGSRWPQALAGVVAVLVAFAGAGTFLALRNARQNGVATTSSGSPAARSGAAMAYDSTAGVTVMYGGTGASGRQLHDTWVWDGTSWSVPQASGGPGPMFEVHMSDDAADGGVLLLGMPDLSIANGNGSGSGGSIGSIGGIGSCVIGASGSGSATAGSVAVGPPTAAETQSPVPATTTPASSASGSAGAATSASSSGTAPPASVPPTALANPPASPCPAVVTPTVQTWLFTAHGWHRVDAGAKATMPAGNAQLAYDPASGMVLAVAVRYFPCGVPLGSGATQQPQIACEMLPAGSGASSSTGSGSASAGSSGSAAAPEVCTVNQCPVKGVLCPLVAGTYSCGGGGSVSTWVWSGGHWDARPITGPASAAAAVPLSGADGRHATLVVNGTQFPCVGPKGGCSLLQPMTDPAFEIWQWTGSAWGLRMSGLGRDDVGLTVAGSSVAALDGTMVVVADDGSTRTVDLATGKVVGGGSVTPRLGEAIAEGPSGTAVLFGGIALNTATGAPSAVGITSSGVAPGSDTWRWDGHVWTHVAGKEPVVPPSPTVCAANGASFKGCVIPPGVPSILPAPAGTPGSAPGSSGTVPTAAP